MGLEAGSPSSSGLLDLAAASAGYFSPVPLVGALTPFPPEGPEDPPPPPFFFTGSPRGVTAMMPMLPAIRMPKKVPRPPEDGSCSAAWSCQVQAAQKVCPRLQRDAAARLCGALCMLLHVQSSWALALGHRCRCGALPCPGLTGCCMT